MEVSDVERNYLHVNKTCGSVAGIWPYNSTRSKWISRIIMLTITFTGMMTQIAYVLRDFGVDTIIEQCPFFLVGLGVFLKELNYVINEKELKSLLEIIFSDWLVQRSEEETTIIDKFARKGLFFNHLYVGNGIFCYVIFTAVAVSPRVMDLVSPKNESRGVGFIYPAYYGLDEEEHYYLLFGHMLCVITVVFFVYISSDTIYMNIVQHACGLLVTSGYRFSIAVDEMVPSDEKGYAKMIAETHSKVRESVKMHQHAMKFVMQIETVHATYFCIAVALVMISFSVTLVKASMMDPCVEFYKYCGFVIVQLIHVLFLCIQGHFILIAHDVTYNHICSAVWYNASRKTQILYMLALRRNLTPPVLTAGGLISLDLETFSEIIKGSVSFFTVMKST